MEEEKLRQIFRALGDETRFQIFGILRSGSQRCACEILEALRISQSTLSHHMKILCDSGLVLAERRWKWTYYSVDGVILREMIGFLEERRSPVGR